MCWDILNNLTNDYRLLFKYQVGLPTVAYFVSRQVGFLNPVFNGQIYILLDRVTALGNILTTALLESKQ